MNTNWFRRDQVARTARAVAMLAVLGGSGFEEDRQSVTGATFPRSTEGDNELPFTLEDGYLIVVEARIGERSVKFALDTGATYSVVRTDIANGLEDAHRSVQVVNLESVLTQKRVNVTDFRLGPIRISQLPMMTNDLEYLRATAPEVQGLLGLDVLRLQSFSIDFGRRKIRFGAQSAFRWSAAMKMEQSYLAVEVCMLDRSMRLLVDTGVRTILLYRDRMGERLPNVKIERQITAASLSGVAHLEFVTLPRVLLNGTELERRAVLLRNSPAGFLPEVDGYLSLASLRARRFCFDFDKNLLSWD